MKTQIKKQKSHFFGKDVYLLGEYKNGKRYWLEAPSWNGGWYWGFGYVETYEGNRWPEKAKDIDSHTHIDTSFIGRIEYYDPNEKSLKTDFIHNIYDTPLLSSVNYLNNSIYYGKCPIFAIGNHYQVATIQQLKRLTIQKTSSGCTMK
jgi:hypothetical protein